MLRVRPVVMTRLFPRQGTLSALDGGRAWPELHELQERRRRAVSEMRAINDKAEAEKRDYSATPKTTSIRN